MVIPNAQVWAVVCRGGVTHSAFLASGCFLCYLSLVSVHHNNICLLICSATYQFNGHTFGQES